MKIAAFICGLVAGFAVLLAPSALDLDLMGPFLKLWPAASTQQMLGTLAWYAIPLAAVAGGLLAVVVPGFAALLLIGAAAAWLAAGLQEPALLNVVVLGAMGLAVLGALLALVAGELDVRRRRLRRRSRRLAAQTPDPEQIAEEEREAALRIDPQLMPRERVTPPPRQEIPLKLEDVIEVMPPPPPPRARHWKDEVRPEPLLSEPAVAVREPAPRRERRSNTGWLLAANGVLIAIIVAGAGYLLVVDGRLAGLLGQPQPGQQAEAVPTPAPTAKPAAVKLPEAPRQQAAAATPTAPAATAAAAAPQTYADPFAYCSALGTVDFVDHRYAGPPVAAAIATALAVPTDAAPDRVHWRCYQGAVYACASYSGPVCEMTPTVDEMIAYCKLKQQVQELAAPNGTWSCRNGRPELPPDASWPVDRRGFFPGSWVRVPPPAAG